MLLGAELPGFVRGNPPSSTAPGTQPRQSADGPGNEYGPPQRYPRPKGRYDTQDFGGDPAGNSMILFAVSTLSYTDTRTIGWPFLITIPAFSAASAVAYDPFVCLSTWSKNRPTSGRLLCESTSCTIFGAGSSASRSLITRVAIRCLFLLKNIFLEKRFTVEEHS